MVNKPVVRVGIIGAGNVGGALVELLNDPERQRGADSTPRPVRSNWWASPCATRPSGARGFPRQLLTTDVAGLVANDDLDILVELAGGIKPARVYIETALRHGVSVVTANKALMAECGTELAQLAHQNGADLFYEAAVGGGIPILRALRTSLAGERINRVMGIVNGTTNFILSKMTSEGSDYAAALKEAQALGYAEADPSADVEGYDAAAKVQILASLAFGTELAGEAIYRQGIVGIRSVDVEFARRSGYVIKLLGVAERVGDAGLSQRAHPAMIPVDHPLASVHGAMNAVFVEGVRSGPLDVARPGRRRRGDRDRGARRPARRRAQPLQRPSRRSLPGGAHAAQRPGRRTGERLLHQHRRAWTDPGVLAAVAGIFGDNGVSIQSMEQSGFGDEARLSFLTHMARHRPRERHHQGPRQAQVGRLDRRRACA